MIIPFAIPTLYDKIEPRLSYNKINILIDTDTLELYEEYVYNGGLPNSSKMQLKSNYSIYYDIFIEFLKEKFV